MKKILCLILMVMFLAVGTANADYIRGSSGTKLETYVVYGTNEAISVSVIPAGTRILGFSVFGDGAASFAGLYDCATVGETATTALIAEGSAPSDQTEDIWFPMPYTIETQLTVILDASTSGVNIYYE